MGQWSPNEKSVKSFVPRNRKKAITQTSLHVYNRCAQQQQKNAFEFGLCASLKRDLLMMATCLITGESQCEDEASWNVWKWKLRFRWAERVSRSWMAGGYPYCLTFVDCHWRDFLICLISLSINRHRLSLVWTSRMLKSFLKSNFWKVKNKQTKKHARVHCVHVSPLKTLTV